MSDIHHVVRQQDLKRRFPRGAVEVAEKHWSGGYRLRLVPVEKPPNPAHLGLLHVSLNKLLKDERNLLIVSREQHDRHHNANDPYQIEPPPEAWEFARWCGLDWRLEREAA